MTDAELIAYRCKWAYEDAVRDGNVQVAQVLYRCLTGATHGRKPNYTKPAYVPGSNTVKVLNSIEGGALSVRED